MNYVLYKKATHQNVFFEKIAKLSGMRNTNLDFLPHFVNNACISLRAIPSFN